jgi:hypothetical protein
MMKRAMMKSLVTRALDLMEDPIICRRIATATAWVAVGVFAFAPGEAMAAFPIARLDGMRQDVQDHITDEGSWIGASLGLGKCGLQMILSNFEGGVGGVVRTGGGGAVMGSSPEVASYMTQA